MTCIWSNRFLRYFIFGVLFLFPNIAYTTSALHFDESLAAIPCMNQGDLYIKGTAYVRAGEAAECQTSGGNIYITELKAESGSKFRVSALPQSENLTLKWAETNCDLSTQADCNYCAFDVRKQFQALFDKNLPNGARTQTETLKWHYRGNSEYEPSGRKPKDAFFIAGNTFKFHVQGFVRTNSSFWPYAGTYSYDSPGTIFFISQEVLGTKLNLNFLYNAFGDHPTGMSVIGDYVIFGDYSGAGTSGRALRVINVGSSASYSKYIMFNKWQTDGEERTINMGGGVGMVKLSNGGYLLIATGPGGPTYDLNDVLPEGREGHDDPRYTDFIYLIGKKQTNGTRVQFPNLSTESSHLDFEYSPLGRFYQNTFGSGARKKEFQYSENLTVIPECKSGDIYVVHTSSNEPDKARQEKTSGFWRLSRVEWKQGGPVLNILDAYKEQQDFGTCLHRAAATAWVNDKNEIELTCSEYRARKVEVDDVMHLKRRWVNY